MNLALVEDNARTRGRIANLLSAALPSACVTQFDHLGAALAFAAQTPQDYWLIDLGLPDGSGIDLIRFVRTQHAKANILVISVFGDVENIVKSIQAGADGYLLKDAIDKDLVQAIHAIGLGGTPLSPMIASKLLERMLPPTALPEAHIEAVSLLSVKETELLNLLSRGYKYAEAAQLMKVELSTVQSHIKRIYTKLAVKSRAEAIFEAKALGILKL